VALQFARHYPDRVLSLIPHGSSPPRGFGLPWTGADRPRFEEWAKIAPDEGMAAFRCTVAAPPLMEIAPGRPEVRTGLAELLAAYRGGRLLSPATPSGPLATISMDDISGITVPALTLIGDREVPFLQIVSQALAYYLPDAELVVVPGGGHLVNLTEPERYSAAVLTFLAEVEKSRNKERDPTREP
jgi:pimeloyl-ACP methyl ester carboxylesterase